MGFYKPRVYYPLLMCSLVFSLIACTKDREDPRAPAPAAAPLLQVNAAPAETVSEGTSAVQFEITSEVNAMQLVAHAENVQLRLVKLLDSEGNFLFDSDNLLDRQISSAAVFQASPHTFNYPLIAKQAAIRSGSFFAFYETRDPRNNALLDSEVTLDVITKLDNDFSRGTLNINLLLGGVASNSKATLDATRSAMRISRIMLERFGILIYTNEISLPQLPDIVNNPITGDSLYEELSAASEGGINLIIANDIRNFTSERYVSALAGASPGPVIPTRRSAIVVSIRKATGTDGLFDASFSSSSNRQTVDRLDDSEIRLFAESITHAILRYLGLPISQNFAAGITADTDGLDSEKCPTLNSCQDNKGANGNLMFPFPLQVFGSRNNSGDSFFPRDRLSKQQIEIAQRHMGID